MISHTAVLLFIATLAVFVGGVIVTSPPIVWWQVIVFGLFILSVVLIHAVSENGSE